MLPQSLKSFRQADLPLAVSHARVILVCKLILFAALLPILISLGYELYAVLKYRFAEGKMLDLRLAPIIHATVYTLGVIFSVAFIWFVCSLIIPPLIFLFYPPWMLCCFLVGLFIDVVVVAPRMFVGELLSHLLPADTPQGHLPRSIPIKYLTGLLLALVAISSVASLPWRPWYQYRVETARSEYQLARQAKAASEAAEIHRHLEDAREATEIEDAIRHVETARMRIEYATTYSDAARSAAIKAVHGAHLDLTTAKELGKTEVEQWRPLLRERIWFVPVPKATAEQGQ